MTFDYSIEDTSGIISPGVVLFADAVENNIRKTISIAGSPERLRPHCKTHKTAEVARLLLDHGITRHKAATFAEAEMLADAGAEDVFLAYNMVGPNIRRAVAFRQRYPGVRFAVTGDHPSPLAALGEACAAAGVTIQVLLDVDPGLHRTGLPAGAESVSLYRWISETPGLEPGGLHVYDGHHHQSSLEDRTAGVMAEWARIGDFREALAAAGLSVPQIVAGGTPTFPVYAAMDDPVVQCSPGTCLLQDAGYGGLFPDLVFTPAALLLTRVISCPGQNRVTLDLGTKAVASDPPAGQRVSFPAIPDAQAILQNEEHLVLETSRAAELAPGDELLAIPTHICPTMALHKEAVIVRDGQVCDRWAVVARDRCLTV